METIEQTDEAVNRNRVAVFVIGGLVAIAALAIVIAYFNRPPQMGTDEEVFKTVDALYTAVRMKDEAKVAQCDTLLQSYRESGKLAKDSAAYLDRVIAKARDRQWESATEKLYEFMLAQRREGAEQSHHADKHKHGRAAGTK